MPWLQHTRPPCSSPTPGVHPNSCPLSRWCHPTISSSVIHFSSCPQSFPASGSFPVNQLFTSGGQSIGASASALVLPMNIQGWFLLRLTGLISLLSKELSRVFSNTTVQVYFLDNRHTGCCLSLCSLWMRKLGLRQAKQLSQGYTVRGFPGGWEGREFACNAGDPGLIPGSGRSHEEGSEFPEQRSPAVYGPRGGKEADMATWLILSLSI